MTPDIKIGIVAKGLIIVAIPLLFECGLVALLSNLEAQADAAALQADRANEISVLINELIQELYVGVKTIKLSGHSLSDDYDRKERIASAKAKIVLLKSLIQSDNPQGLETLKAAEIAIAEGDDMLKRATQAFEQNDMVMLQKVREQSRNFANRVITPDLIALGEQQKRISQKNVPLQAAYRSQMRTSLLAAFLISILGTFILALITTRSVTRRLVSLADNSRRIGRGDALNQPMSGSDEISELDNTLHKMAAEISQLLQRERIILQNATDIILVLDRELKILRISPSVETVTGYAPGDLIGNKCLTLFDQAPSSEVFECMSGFIRNGDLTLKKPKLEAVLLTKSGKKINLLVSISYIASEENLLIILHDVSSLKEAEQLKKDVVNMVSHDLRSPLTMVSQTVEMLGEGLFGKLNQEGLDLLQRAEESTRQMTLLISDLLDFERLESGTIRLNMATTSSLALLEQARASTIDQALAARCQVKISIAEGFVYCDQNRVNQILVNLINNALKFSPADSEVRLTAEREGEKVLFSVIDRGRGITEEQQKQVFERFKQVRGEDGKSGFGLGLPICKLLVEKHGGTIGVNSNSLGSVFSFTLPQVREQKGPAVTISGVSH